MVRARKVTEQIRKQLTDKGFLTPESTSFIRSDTGTQVEVPNRHVGEVVSNNILNEFLARNAISPQNAMDLITIERDRPKGPRDRIVRRLISVITSGLGLGIYDYANGSITFNEFKDWLHGN